MLRPQGLKDRCLYVQNLCDVHYILFYRHTLKPFPVELQLVCEEAPNDLALPY